MTADGPSGGADGAPRPLTLRSLVLVDPLGGAPVPVDALRMEAGGIAVTRSRAAGPQTLPWADVVAHAVEPWTGGTVPAAWLAADAPADALPYVAPGTLVSVQTSVGTYRFLRPGIDPGPVADRFDAFVVHHQGPGAASTVTRAAGRPRRSTHPGVRGPVWRRARPVLIVLAAAAAAVLIALVLLQSAGVVHLPVLGGSSSPGGGLGPGRPPGT